MLSDRFMHFLKWLCVMNPPQLNLESVTSLPPIGCLLTGFANVYSYQYIILMYSAIVKRWKKMSRWVLLYSHRMHHDTVHCACVPFKFCGGYMTCHKTRLSIAKTHTIHGHSRLFASQKSTELLDKVWAWLWKTGYSYESLEIGMLKLPSLNVLYIQYLFQCLLYRGCLIEERCQGWMLFRKRCLH